MRTWPWEKQLSPWVGDFHRGLEAAGNNSFSPKEYSLHQGGECQTGKHRNNQEPDSSKAVGRILAYHGQSLEDLRGLRC